MIPRYVDKDGALGLNHTFLASLLHSTLAQLFQLNLKWNLCFWKMHTLFSIILFLGNTSLWNHIPFHLVDTHVPIMLYFHLQ